MESPEYYGQKSNAWEILDTPPPQFESWVPSVSTPHHADPEHPADRRKHDEPCLWDGTCTGRGKIKVRSCWCTESALKSSELLAMDINWHHKRQKWTSFYEFLQACPLGHQDFEAAKYSWRASQPIETTDRAYARSGFSPQSTLRNCYGVMLYFRRNILEPVMPLLSTMHYIANRPVESIGWDSVWHLDHKLVMDMHTYEDNHVFETSLISSPPGTKQGRFTLLTIAYLPPGSLTPSLTVHRRTGEFPKEEYSELDNICYTDTNREAKDGKLNKSKTVAEWKKFSILARSYANFPMHSYKSHYTLEQSQRRVFFTDGAGYMLMEFKAGKIRVMYGPLSIDQPEGKGIISEDLCMTAKETLAYAVYRALEEDLGFECLDYEEMKVEWRSILGLDIDADEDEDAEELEPEEQEEPEEEEEREVPERREEREEPEVLERLEEQEEQEEDLCSNMSEFSFEDVDDTFDIQSLSSIE
ncbi:hypothetical protein BJ508DRAFT_44028 [Ascobolus immersus RN42]|uniref:Uncharacterized protein n=1 Tax=Ascobolus immersus RN42 TaxID=1160509 RepID=A0A3N4HJA1_ASCIM|nr:hypothetical protein BJ508DRAFT_44028 [Ascobolus immersus RN42]